MTLLTVLYAALIGGSAGVLGGLLGIGGGIIMVPLLQSLLGRGIHDAKTTSLAIIGFISIVGTFEAAQHRRLDWSLILLCGLFASVTSTLGVRLGERMSTTWLLRLFSLFLIAMGCKYLYASFQPAPAKPIAVHERAPGSPHDPSSTPAAPPSPADRAAPDRQ
ncbi:MAG: sulfite exporter TauE/SafE family protein [Armatimonadetes bacterium]|nr:sulfite exporter TauE/SafE family protein [Armatimonadota bacterium]